MQECWERGNCLNVLMCTDFYWWCVEKWCSVTRCSKTFSIFKRIAPIFRYFCLSVPREFHPFEEINFVYPENTNTLSFYFCIIQTRTKCYCLTNSFVWKKCMFNVDHNKREKLFYEIIKDNCKTLFIDFLAIE